MTIQVKTTQIAAVDDPSWLGSGHGLDSTESATLLVALFTAGTHYPNGYFPSGLPLGKVTASGKYGPYDDTATDGRQTLVGHLVGPREITTGQVNADGAILTHGKVREARLPIAVDAAGKTDVAGRIQYV